MAKRPRTELAEDELAQLDVTAGDLEWWQATGHCGGCGSASCHPRKACIGDRCIRCPSRDTPDPEES